MKLTKIKDMIIYKDTEYSSFPTVVKLPSGKLVTSFRHARNMTATLGKTTHIDPASKGVLVTSDDQGESWSQQFTVIYDDFYLGIQDPCINLLQDGTLFCTFFSWKVLPAEDVERQERDVEMFDGQWIGRLGGVYSIRSFDEGRTWDKPLPIVGQGQGIRGNAVQLDDGTILQPMYVTPDDSHKSLVAATKDLGKTWETKSVLATSPDCYFREPTLHKTPSGKLVAFLRSEKLTGYDSQKEKYPLFTCESLDHGATWSPVKEHAIYSPSPFHALTLKSGKTLLTYGHRNPPYGIRALLLDPECEQIVPEEEVILRDDAPGFDIGYTSSVQLDNGDILVTYYYYDEGKSERYIAGTVCREVD